MVIVTTGGALSACSAMNKFDREYFSLLLGVLTARNSGITFDAFYRIRLPYRTISRSGSAVALHWHHGRPIGLRPDDLSKEFF